METAKKVIVIIIKILLYIGIAIGILVFAIGVWYFQNGSLEMHPTDEQQGIAMIGAIIIMVLSFGHICLLVGIRLIMWIVGKCLKRKKQNTN